MMNKKSKRDKMTCQCPSGHKLRGSVDLIGKTVRCPRCNEKFVFGYQVREKVTDTAVVRLLGDGPTPPPIPGQQKAMRPCSRCGTQIPNSVSVCEHCKCYVGALPDFFQQIQDSNEASHN
jgi:hypothetical protein